MAPGAMPGGTNCIGYDGNMPCPLAMPKPGGAANDGIMAEFIIMGATCPRYGSSAGPAAYAGFIATPCGNPYAGGGRGCAAIIGWNCIWCGAMGAMLGIGGIDVGYVAGAGAYDSKLLESMLPVRCMLMAGSYAGCMLG